MENSFNVNMRVVFRYFSLALIACLVSSCGIIPHRYQAAPISGKVIDKETGKPVEGVHVAVYWQLYDDSVLGGLGGRVATDVIGVSETVTDEKGFYHIPGWGPEYVSGDYLGEESPMIGFYKTGYEFEEVFNSNMTLLVNKDYISEGYEYSKKETEKGDVYISNWDGLIVKLDKEESDVDKIKLNLENTYRFIDRIMRGEGCESKLVEKLILEYSENAKSLKKLIQEKYPEKQRYIKFYSIEDMSDMHCAPVKETLK